MDKHVMKHGEKEQLTINTIELVSEFLERTVRIDFYYTQATNFSNEWDLLLVNDGQDLEKMPFSSILASADEHKKLTPLMVAAIHCGPDRKNEYGMSVAPDYKGRGVNAARYEKFILMELLPLIENRYRQIRWKEKGFAGFSLGALSALDIAWHNPAVFSRVGIFSGSLWWRSVDQNDKHYDGSIHRLMHQHIRKGKHQPGMKFFFECGELDESEDRNRNGVIDSIDDTLDLMRELLRKGYLEGRDMVYLQLPDGKHDVPSWAKAFPVFLKWGYDAGSRLT